jgi:FkbM family methyltransferase
MSSVERWAAKLWRVTGRRLPPRAAEAIRVPTRRALRRLGLIGRRPGDAAAVECGHHAQNDRWVIEAVFPGLRGGFFVEGGACGGGVGSASYVLERSFDWRGICVEPGDEYFRLLQEDRTCAKDRRCLADRTGHRVEWLSYPDDLGRSGIRSLNKNATWAEQHQARSRTATKETVTLADLLVQHDAPRIIHYLCLDVEGAERTILEPFDFEGNWEILAISVEGSTCDELLAERGYLRVENPFEPHSIDHYFIRPQLRMEYDAHVARLEQTREVPGPR